MLSKVICAKIVIPKRWRGRLGTTRVLQLRLRDFFAVHESVHGTSRHVALRPLMVAFGLKRTFVSCPPGRIYEFTP